MQHDEISRWLSPYLKLSDVGVLEQINYDDKYYSWGKRIYLCSFSGCVSEEGSVNTVIDIRYSVNRDLMFSNLIDFYYDKDNEYLFKEINNVKYNKLVIYILSGDDIDNIFAEISKDVSSYINGNIIWRETKDKYLVNREINLEKIGYVKVNNIPLEINNKFMLEDLSVAIMDNLDENRDKTHNDRKIKYTPNILLTDNRYKCLLELRGNHDNYQDYSNMISVITVVYNNVELIEQTIQSIINQNNENIEYIIIDGGSTDGTVDIIKKYESRINFWISEADTGIYDAMNKGIALSEGGWLIFINSDDLLASQQSLGIDLKNYSGNAVAGRTLMLGDYYNWIRPESEKQSIYRYSHQSILTKKLMFYNLSYQVASDNDYLSRYASNFEYTDKVISIFRMGGFSTDSVTLLQIKERYNVTGLFSMFMLIFRLITFYLFGEKIIEIVRVFKNRYI